MTVLPKFQKWFPLFFYEGPKPFIAPSLYFPPIFPTELKYKYIVHSILLILVCLLKRLPPMLYDDRYHHNSSP